ncbi:Ldh family oxidoreductase [Polaromonas sp. SM01]|uniref:Ldh family oxidoreductase n=1 Tax=Polaromonas sp. SM01 TaxID=3085630 RepID=UPI002982981C|nr:Ldh family oxidoreductase [Polaromonas sp. SM01]MDW5443952.1 Ldh family oxidoreductase [Polaromonas sp. SM01]
MQKTLQAPELRSQVATVLIAAGSTPEEAATVAANLVQANLSGHDSHGVGMLPRYVEAVLEGGLKPNSSVRVVLDTGSLLTLDGQRGYGQVVGEQAMALGMARAKTHGSCIMSLANAHHLGRIGHFAEMAVAQGLVSLHFVNVLSRPVVAPFGGADGRYGTNPCCIGIPLKGRRVPRGERSEGPPQASSAPPGGSASHEVESVGAHFILDFATSQVAQGKMRVAHNEGRQVEAGLLIDEHGLPTTKPGVVVVPQSNGLFGALLAFGGHKGYGMAVACELLGGALTGSGTAHQPADPAIRAVVNGMLTILIDPAKLGTQASFEQEALAFVDWLQVAPAAPGVDAVLLAGDPERATRLQRQETGIEVDAQTWQDMRAAGRQVGVDLPE